MEQNTVAFGGELRRMRKERGVTLAWLSSRTNTSAGHLSKVEREIKPPSRQLAEACDNALGAKGELQLLGIAELARMPKQHVEPTFVGLPSAPTRFVGRSEELARIAMSLAEDSGSTVCAVSGLAGTGKTALLLRGAWDALEFFPDGCFYFDFDGGGPHGSRSTSYEVLSVLLGVLGVAREELPTRVDAMANLWRDRTRGKRLLLVLDNVTNVRDIVPLVPTDSGCKMLVAGRRRLNALDDAVQVELGVLGEDEADTLFRTVAGERATQAEQRTVRAVAEHCGRLPLALCIAAALLRRSPTRTAAMLEEALSHEAHRLELLDDGDRSVTAALTVSCDLLPWEQQQLLALIALHPGPSVDLGGIAALADIELPRAAMVIDVLADAHLVTYETPDRFTLHDLVRQFARLALLPDLTDTEQHRALGRLLEYCLSRTVAADRLLTPQRYRPPVVLDEFPPRPAPFADRAAGVAWLTSEWRCLVALCRTAGARGLHSQCWQLAFALRDFFFLEKLWGPWIETHLAAVESARAAGARAWLAISLGNLGVAHSDRGDLTVAVGYFKQSLELYRQLDDEHGVVNTISHLAWAEMYLGEYAKSLEGLRTAMSHYRRMGNRRNAAIALRGIAMLETELGRCPVAVEHAREAREEFLDLGLELDVVLSLNCSAWAQFRSGDHRAARADYEEAFTRAESCGSRYEMARSLTGLGNIHRVSGDRERAARLWARADALYGGLEPVMLGEARVRLAS
ncbi:NB-ARC domain-containing protein [Streptomyces griseoviridis]|uniref:NB-ARC domain-containing protein n=1 Tax=Streptomyces griseoviridis TaxID=45398 RepID=UPI0034154394